MASDPMNLPATRETSLLPATPLVQSRGWWVQVLRVRLRFFFIVVFVALVVGQWPLVRSVWDRWIWSFSHKSESGSVSMSHEYFCPMDPGQISVWPGICPICNMDLVRRKKMEAVMLPEGVVARMQLSPYRIQLAGVRTAVIESRPLNREWSLAGVLRRMDDGTMGFDAPLSANDRTCFVPVAATRKQQPYSEPNADAQRPAAPVTTYPADCRVRATSETISGTVRAIDDAESSHLRFRVDEGTTLQPGVIVDVRVSIPVSDQENVLAVPESAVIDRGDQRLVYVETMPGMFDGVAVELGRRCGSFYLVKNGLKAGQRVASAGAFLIDAETRLNPSLAAGYFGANQSDPKQSAPAPTVVTPQNSVPKKEAPPKTTLSPEDQVLADKQGTCPVTDLPLDSMGGPVPVVVVGRKVFICCAGCEKRLKGEPEKYLAKLGFK